MSGINIKVGGQGSLNIGNLAQGENITIASGEMSFSERRQALTRELLKAARTAAADDEARFQAIHEKVRQLGEELAAQPPNPGKIKSILALIKDHHGWAFPAIAAVAAKIVPAIGALL